jgi:quercetin dioxygenase-like cupin family protein
MSRSASVVTTGQGQPRTFRGVRFEVLATGPHSMVTKMLYADGDEVAEHAHPNEQAGFVVSARVRLTIAGDTFALGPGDSYVIPADVPHSLTVVSAGEVVDVFTPPREDYL